MTTLNSTIGIDIGSQNVRVAVMANNWPAMLVHDRSDRSLPNCVAFNGSLRLIAKEAEEYSLLDPENSIECAKQFLGKSFQESYDEIKRTSVRCWSRYSKAVFEVVYNGENKIILPEQIYIELLSYCRLRASNHLKLDVQSAIVTVPSFFTDKQRRAVFRSAEIAGFNSVKLLNENTSTAISYAFNNNSSYLSHVLIIDFGARYFQATVIELEDPAFRVLSHVHDQIGGADFDEILVRHFAARIDATYQRDIYQDPCSLKKLRVACENAKIDLSFREQGEVVVDELFNETLCFRATITNELFQSLTAQLLDKVNRVIDRALQEASNPNFRCARSDIDDVLLVGGSSKLPQFRGLISRDFETVNTRMTVRINSDESVAMGGLIYELRKYSDPQTIHKMTELTTRNFALFINNSYSLYIPKGTPINTKYGFDLNIEDPVTASIFENDRHVSMVEVSPDKKEKYKISCHVDNDGILQAFNYIYHGPGFRSKMKRSLKPEIYSNDEIRQMTANFYEFDADHTPKVLTETRVHFDSKKSVTSL